MSRGINFACACQDLRQGFFTAKYVFEHAPKRSIKFVLIGLTPYSLRYDCSESFAVCVLNYHFSAMLKNFTDETNNGKMLNLLVNDWVKNFYDGVTAAQADPNLRNYKNSNEISAEEIMNWEIALAGHNKKFRKEVIERNLQFFKDYIKLCVDNGAKPVGVLWPFSPIIRSKYHQDMLMHLRWMMKQYEESYDFTFIDLFDLPLGYDCFFDLTHMNLRGNFYATNALNAKLHERNILPLNGAKSD